MKKEIVLLTVLAVLLLSLTVSVKAAEDPRISVSFISQTPDPVEPGDYVELRWKIDNLASKSTDYTFELDYNYPFSLDPSETARKSVGSLTGYQTLTDGAIIYWKARVAEDAVEGYMNKVKLKYWKTSEPDFVISSNEQVIRIQSKQGIAEIGQVTITPEEVELGNMFEMKIEIDNKGTGFIDNVKVKVDTTGTGFTPVGTTNQKIIKRISGQSSQDVTFKFFVDADTDIKVNQLPVILTYYDKFSTEYTDSTFVGVPVTAQPAYLTNLEDTELFMGGKKGRVVVSISNIGKDMLNFVVLEMVDTDDYDIISSPKSYLGNLESDDFETGQFDIFIYPSDKNSVPLVFNLHYRDSYDKVYSEKFSLQNKLYSHEKATEIGLMAPVDYSATALIWVVVIGLVGFWWYRRRCRKKCKRK
ncbi:MAG: hypothetical protein JW716_00215 [Candidatus Aenigmarchaeota archaeon]|nr:hypothetical protein [Candidatus Aenigmarchaeota archaeon]